jgi:cytochrome c
MPNLKNFSLKAKNFHNHFSVTHNTRGNLASMFYGASSSLTKVMGRKQSFRDSSLKTLQKILGENNYFTSYIGTQPLFHSEKPNDDLDFTECIYLSPSMSDFYINAEKFNNYLFNKIEKINENSLLFLHYSDCHEPFETPDNILNKKDFFFSLGKHYALQDGKTLIEGSDCRTCHKDDTKLIGPSYQDVAKKYANNAENVKLLAGKIIKGGQGVWGEIPMSPHPNVTEDDAAAMVEYILSMNK